MKYPWCDEGESATDECDFAARVTSALNCANKDGKLSNMDMAPGSYSPESTHPRKMLPIRTISYRQNCLVSQFLTNALHHLIIVTLLMFVVQRIIFRHFETTTVRVCYNSVNEKQIFNCIWMAPQALGTK
jgi:hypothetical protein